MNDLVDIIFDVDINELPLLNFPINERFGLIIHLNDVKYEFLIKLNKNSDKLLCLGSGALGFDSKHDRSKPYFNRWSWDFEYSTICYNDPTLYLDSSMRGGWGVGTPDDYYLENIAAIIHIISESLSISSENIIFYGSSAGGFMSIILAILIKGSTAIADIPQLLLENYFQWDDLKKFCFNGLDEDLILKNYKHRLNVIDMCNRENYIPNAILVFDCSVTHDIDLQYAPFIKNLNQLPYANNSNKFNIIIDGKNKGHSPLDKKESYELINDVVNNKLLNNGGGKTILLVHCIKRMFY